MKTCPNHPNKKAEYVCHGCGKYYCKSCLTEEGEYYFCNEPACQKLLQAERKKELLLPPEITCPNCQSEFHINDNERRSGKIHCPECESFIDFSTDPPVVQNKKEYTQIFYSLNQGDIGIVKSILDDGDIDYYVFGENFLSVDPLIQPARFFVANDQIDEAKELLKDFTFKTFGTSMRQEED